MISTTSLVLDGHHHAMGPGPTSHHMPFADPSYLRSRLGEPVPTEFLRPLPKPAPIVPARYPNGSRPPPSQSPRKDYLNIPVTSSAAGPVNLAKDGENCESQVPRTSGSLQMAATHMSPGYTSRLFTHPGFYASPYPSLYTSPYPTLLNRPTYIGNTNLSNLERQFSPPQQSAPANAPTTFLQPFQSQNQKPPHHPPQQSLPVPPPAKPPPAVTAAAAAAAADKRPFKVPTGRDTKSKQLLLRNRRPVNNNNNTLPPNFTKGSLIQLGNGELRRVEDVTTEDLVSSAQRCPAFRLDPSTVLRIEETSSGSVTLTLSHGENKRMVEIESTPEHPYYVYGQGWASCSPKRTLSCYGLTCRQLQVGDVCVSLSPRQQHNSNSSKQQHNSRKHSPTTHLSSSTSPPSTMAVERSQDDDMSCKRRRWSAPDQLDGEEEVIDPGSPSPIPKRLKE